ncbi:hypothetical protein E4U26_001568 [Claviceps purpurea]|nr:hypothetical protein E4U26_001568 [Claviceps purpurea]
MYSGELLSIPTSYSDYFAKIDPRSHLCLIDDVAEKPGEESSRSRNGDTAPGAFPQFMRLPPELRHQVWHFYCPDLSVKARVLPFKRFPSSTTMEGQIDYSPPADDYQDLAERTKSLRAVLSTHRESRSIAVRKYPDELVMDSASGAAVVRFRKETDVIFVMELWTDVNYSVPDFGKQIENLAIRIAWDDQDRYYASVSLLEVPTLEDLFPNLRRLFSYTLGSEWLRHRGWCTCEYTHWHKLNTYWPDWTTFQSRLNLDVDPSGLYKRKAIVVDTDVEEGYEMGHDTTAVDRRMSAPDCVSPVAEIAPRQQCQMIGCTNMVRA